MIYIDYLQYPEINDKQITDLIKFLPENFKRQANGQLISDKEGILERLLLHKICEENSKTDPSMLHFGNTNNSKLFIENFPAYSLSHFGNVVLIAYSTTNSSLKIGVDVVQNKMLLNWLSLTQHFTTGEINKVRKADYPSEEFFKVLTRKKALCKAIGIDLKTKLKACDSLSDFVYFERQRWFFKTFSLLDTYIISCAANTENQYQINELNFNSLLQRQNIIVA